MSQYGILNDLLGQRADVPHSKLPSAMVSDESRFVHYWRNAVRRLPGRGQALSGTQTPDGNPIIHYQWHESSAGAEYLFCYTKAHVYIWDNTNTEWDLMFTCASDCTRWSSESFGTAVVSTNNVDKVQVWYDTTPATAFADLGGANGIEYSAGVYLTKAEYVKRHGKYLHLASTEENSVSYPYRRRWCSPNDLTSWIEGTNDANYTDYASGERIRGMAVYDVQSADHLITFTQKSVEAQWLTDDNNVYNGDYIHRGVGCISAASIVETPDGHVYYMSVDEKSGTVEVRRVYDSATYSYDIQPTLNNMHPINRQFSCGAYFGIYNKIFWSIPGQFDSDDNDTVIILNRMTNTWDPIAEMDIGAFGYYTQQSTTFIDDISDFIDDVSDIIDTLGPTTGSPLVLCSDADGYTYSFATSTQDKGSDYTGSLVLVSDLGGGGLYRNYLHGLWLIYETYSGTTYTVTAAIKGDDENDYTNMGTVSIAGTGKQVRQWIRYNKSLRDLHLRLSSTNDADFVGVIFDYDQVGTRR